MSSASGEYPYDERNQYEYDEQGRRVITRNVIVTTTRQVVCCGVLVVVVDRAACCLPHVTVRSFIRWPACLGVVCAGRIMLQLANIGVTLPPASCLWRPSALQGNSLKRIAISVVLPFQLWSSSCAGSAFVDRYA